MVDQCRNAAFNAAASVVRFARVWGKKTTDSRLRWLLLAYHRFKNKLKARPLRVWKLVGVKAELPLPPALQADATTTENGFFNFQLACWRAP